MFPFRFDKLEKQKEKRKSCKSNVCTMCETKAASILYEPCGHCCVCYYCHKTIWNKHENNLCMLCQTVVTSIIKLNF